MKEYVPRYRSGPYALLIALIKAEQVWEHESLRLENWDMRL